MWRSQQRERLHQKVTVITTTTTIATIIIIRISNKRESADHRPVESSHLDPIPKPISSNVMQPTENIAVVQRKPKYDNTPACLGKWKISKFKFCRSLTRVQIKNDKKTKHSGSTSNAVMNNLKVQKKRGFISKFLAVLQKRR
ncbi:uncharacterized protein LOC8283230 isoform X2 [Ricinus communis]|uniref:uncharacterized protein LOC8283230 isoform X2 n=1 Tax=Ricinus communis TaxID=3988 RepID=UPI00201A5F23|nr:uncharacterized protein LOC8283230 isoform X2 [Ricinus communis]